MYGRQSTWDTYSPVARIGDYDPLYIKQRLRGTLSLNWEDCLTALLITLILL